MPPIVRRDFLKAAAAMPVLAAGLMHGAAATAGDTPSAPGHFDYVVAGAGHNGLVCAAYLAKAGYRVLVLEGDALIGGGCKTTEPLLPGFREDLCSSAHGAILGNPLIRDRELDLAQYGYELLYPDVVLHYPFLDGASFTVFRNDVERTAATIEQVSRKDARTFRRAAAVRAGLAAMPAEAAAASRDGLYLRRLGEMTGFAAARAVWESPHMQAAALSGGRFFGPMGSDYGTGRQAFSMLDHLRGRPIPKGGSGMLSVALGRFIEAHGGVILTRKSIVQLVIEQGACKGVECADGTQYRADKGVVSSIHVKHLIDMAPRELFGDAVLDGVDLMQPELAMFQFHFAFTEEPAYALASGGTIASCEAALMEDPASIFTLTPDDAHGELNIADYPLQVCHPSVFDPTRVPAGRGLLKIEGCMPYALKGGAQHWDDIKDQVADTLLTRYLRYTTNLSKDKLLGSFLLSPLDIERINPAMWRGGAHHFDNRGGNFAPCRLGIPGLYQTGACTAPGGSISGLPGRNTAQAVLQDQGRSLKEVVGTPAVS
ncbi:NAD(P)/FAD-dependent oxidoreductase [Pseudomonas gingeri NCPPB 3146 = LMG 5327]|uniref:NAD(P)/FAD-dependent oxidoreductase n=4 Tax=Pseudomonas gingeri TaxID=117681 RepID=A0A7Y7Y565_9PSED|nr:NAD(P)/FAD-dependent oxidoreductase [Pseudomonas gingeri]NWC17884.1 NAD(P)/FAD-dependent oxidoreductase [Pseudomonas gingeri]PNQ90650.1 NAD(P)/FAD-dependent oxidoreductase [Pseudomonas gingeri NCPPB 3146 = LMG 5327]